MRRFKATALGLAVLIMLACYMLFFELKRGERAGEAEKVLEAIRESVLTHFIINYPEYSIEIKKTEGGWVLIEPPGELNASVFPADDELVSTLIEGIARMEVTKGASEYLSDPAAYGLDVPQAVIALMTRKELITIGIGGETPTGSGVYVKVGESAGVAITGEESIRQFLNKTTSDFREKKLLKGFARSISGVRVRTPGRSFELVRVGRFWVAADGSYDFNVDQGSVMEMVSTLTRQDVQGFVDDDPDDLDSLAEYGLDEPVASVELIDGDRVKGIFFGSKSGSMRYVMFGDAPSVFLFPENAYNKVIEASSAVRFFRVFDDEIKSADKFTVEGGGKRASFIKTADGWALKDGTKGGGLPMPDQRLLSFLSGLRVKGFVEKNGPDLKTFGLASPNMSLKIGVGSMTHSLILGNRLEDGQGLVYAMDETSGEIFLVTSELLDVLKGRKAPLIVDEEGFKKFMMMLTYLFYLL